MSQGSHDPRTSGPGAPSLGIPMDGDIDRLELIPPHLVAGTQATILSLTLTGEPTRHYRASGSVIQTLLGQLAETYSREMVKILEEKGLIPAPVVRR